MPWDHCDVDFILDDEVCPRCKVTKAQWTVELGKTRHLRIGRRREFTLRDFGETLAAVHEAEGLIVARRLAARLDYDGLVALCRRWVANPTRETDNDPNRWVHPRYMLLPFMDDALLPEDAREGLYPGDGAGPVLEMCRAIQNSGIPCKESAVFDDEVLVAWRAWRALDRRRLTTTPV